MVEDDATTINKPNAQISIAHSNIILQEVVNLLTTRSYTEDPTAWIPDNFIASFPASGNSNTTMHDINMDHFCAPVIHPVTGESITSYKKTSERPLTKRNVDNQPWKGIW